MPDSRATCSPGSQTALCITTTRLRPVVLPKPSHSKLSSTTFHISLLHKPKRELGSAMNTTKRPSNTPPPNHLHNVLYGTGLFLPTRSPLNFHQDRHLDRLSPTQQGRWTLSQAHLSPMPVFLQVPGCRHVSNLRIAPIPRNMSSILQPGRRQGRTALHSRLHSLTL